MTRQNIDTRWQQRFANFEKALAKLRKSVEQIVCDYYVNGVFDAKLFAQADDIMVEGLIQRFEYTHELAWNVIKDYAAFQGNAEIRGSRDAVRYAFKYNLLQDGEAWMDMIISRNQSSHTYNEETAMEIFAKIIESYSDNFIAFAQSMRALLKDEA